MLKLPLFDDSLYELMRLNARFANTLGRATAEFLRDVVITLNESPLLQPLDPRRPARAPSMRRPDAPTEQSPPAPQPSIMLLESEAGSAALGFFLIENTLNHEVVVRVEASPFVEPPASGARPRLAFYPEVVTLAPREQITMRVMAAIDDTLEPGVRYRCELTVPSLPGTRIPVVIRRYQASVPATPATSAVRPSERNAPQVDRSIARDAPRKRAVKPRRARRRSA